MTTENIRHKLTTFILLSGVAMTVVVIGMTLLLPFLRIKNIYLNYVVLYAVEFGFYCLTLYFYKLWVSRILWFSQGMSILVLITAFKILLSVILLFMIFSVFGMFYQPGLSNLLALFGPFIRGFIVELACIAVAAKIFETDIFTSKPVDNESIIDDLQ